MNIYKSIHIGVTLFVATTVFSCAATIPTSPDEIARETARAVIKPIVASRFPLLPIDGAVDCAIDNATMPELLSLGQAAITTDTSQATQTTIAIMKRPETIKCITTDLLVSGNI